MSLKELKQYLRVDYTDDDSMIELMHDAVIDEMKELIPSFDPEKPTNRQKILICSYVKELYDHRDRMYNNGKITSDSTERIRYAIQSIAWQQQGSNFTSETKVWKTDGSRKKNRRCFMKHGVRSETFTGRNCTKHWMSGWKTQSCLK